ncbi:ABC transporter permease [Aureibacillus halotolerans]|uniref:ABC-2 family transporter n=1 Tax=Aureibacillus halotolerans TaxID=1508390 RepID=A0A4R6UBY4_9BACI|nr:ABC transporter permease [Aureibacillus halotolerans]TDQ42583.1 ABC-2 family transporter [Aureibacillus halotolerans]
MKAMINAFFIRRFWLVLCILLVPVVCSVLFSPLLKTAESEAAIPVAWESDADQNSHFASLLFQRLEQNDRLRLIPLQASTTMEELLISRQVDAGIRLPANFDALLSAGDTDGLISLITSPATLTDGLLRELIGGELARMIFAVKAADRVSWLLTDEDTIDAQQTDLWKSAFADVQSQWEPNPLMTINFQYLNMGGAENSEENMGLLTPYKGFWMLFSWFTCAFAVSWVVTERHLLQRMRTTLYGPTRYMHKRVGVLLILQSANGLAGGYLIHWKGESFTLLESILSSIAFICAALFVILFFALWQKNIGSFWLIVTSLACLHFMLGGTLFPTPIDHVVDTLNLHSITYISSLLWMSVAFAFFLLMEWKVRSTFT